MSDSNRVVNFFRAEPRRWLLQSLVIVLTVRLVLYGLMWAAGYFYGIPWDTFSRTSLAWQWAHQPFFTTDGYWLPLQFWIVGVVYAILRPLSDASSILVPVAVNQLLFSGSTLITGAMAFRLGGRTAVWWAVILVAIFPADIFITYSGLAEPIYIFFILLTNYLIATAFWEHRWTRADWAIGAGAATLLATATHYIGWFLAFFVIIVLGYRAVRSFQNRQFKSAILYASGIFLCAIFPVLWLVNNFVIFGDPLHFARTALQYQADYAGNLSLRGKLGILFKVLLTTLPILCGLGGLALIYFARKNIRQTIYLAPAFVIFALLWLSTFLAYTAPYQEPRYVVIFGWVIIPFIAGWLSALWLQGGWSKKIVPVFIVGIVTFGLFETFHFTNSFGADVRLVAGRAEQWLRSQPGTAKIVIEGASFAETGVIPVVAGNPYRFIVIEEQRWREQATTLVAEAIAKKRMVIAKNINLVSGTDWDRIELERLNDYVIILPRD